jgi:hypothetical protein
LTKSRSPYSTSLDSMISHSDSREDHEVCGKFTTEMIRLLAEVHCIFAQVSNNFIRITGVCFYYYFVVTVSDE